MQGMILTVLSSAAGSAAGCLLSLYLGRPFKEDPSTVCRFSSYGPGDPGRPGDP